MLKQLRKMLIIGISIAICSVTCMYIWVLLEWLFGNDYKLGMSYCYCLIFIEALAQYLVIGACIDGGLRNSSNTPGSGVLVSVLSEGLLCWLVYLLLPSYIQLIGISANWLPVLNFFVGYSALSYLLQIVLIPITFDILIITELILILFLHTFFSGLHLMFFLLDFGIQLLHMGLSTAYDIQAVDLGVFAPTKNLALVLLLSNGIRVGCSFLLQTPYAAMLGQVGYSVTAFICYSYLSRKYLKSNERK